MQLGVSVGIVVFTYIIIELIKRYIVKTDKQTNYLPVVSILTGIIIAVIVFFFDKTASMGIFVGDNLLTAILTGAGSGLIATGGNQVFKKINKLLTGDYKGISDGIDGIIDQANDAKKDD